MLIHNDIYTTDNKTYTKINDLSFTVTLRHNHIPARHKIRPRIHNIMTLYLPLEWGKKRLARKPPTCSWGKTTSK